MLLSNQRKTKNETTFPKLLSWENSFTVNDFASVDTY